MVLRQLRQKSVVWHQAYIPVVSGPCSDVVAQLGHLFDLLSLMHYFICCIALHVCCTQHVALLQTPS